VESTAARLSLNFEKIQINLVERDFAFSQRSRENWFRLEASQSTKKKVQFESIESAGEQFSEIYYDVIMYLKQLIVERIELSSGRRAGVFAKLICLRFR
jgi:hypothetical protein